MSTSETRFALAWYDVEVTADGGDKVGATRLRR